MSNYYGYFVGLVWFVMVSAVVLIAGYQIGESVAHIDQQTHNQRMECIKHGGQIEYEINVGTICKKD